MIIRKDIESNEIDAILKLRDLTEEIKNAGENVAVVLTQSWCPQWSFMHAYLSRMENDKTPADKDIHLFVLVYDNIPQFQEFMSFKENVFHNFHIPYVRYYKKGNLVGETNVIGEDGFLKKFN